MMMSIPLPSLKEMVDSLVSQPSVSSTQPELDQSNTGIINLLANWLDPLGFDIEITPIAGRPGKQNLMARAGSGSDGLILSGHSDTVPFDEHLWQSDPFKILEKDNRWYGLGTCDMKSFFALAIEAARPFLTDNPDATLKRPLIIMATADEESSMSGARQLTRQDVADAGFAVVGEPTGLKPVTRHKGIMMMQLRIEGTAGHSSDPSLGRNAIEGMHQALDELMQFRAELQQNHQDHQFAVSFPTMNFGCIHGGDNPNRICDHAELAFDLRNLPSMDMTDFTGNLEARLGNRLKDQGFVCQLELLYSPVAALDNDGSRLAREISELTGTKTESAAFGTEAPFYQKLDIDTVVVGPGSINQAHQPDEYLPLAQIDPAIDLIRNLISRRCLE